MAADTEPKRCLESMDEVQGGCSYQPRFKSSLASPGYRLEHQLEDPNGTWHRATYLLVTSTAQPPLLALPYAMAGLGFAGGTVSLVASGAFMLYCVRLLARLNEYGGQRHGTYRGLAGDILGPRQRSVVAALQTAVIVGCGITNLILSGQILEAVYQLYCTDCSAMNTPKWTAVAASVLAVFSQLPDLANIQVLTLVTTCFCAIYSTVAVVLSAVQGGGNGAEYSVAGSASARAFGGFNALGTIVFIYGNQVVPELQATLAPDPATKSCVGPMVRGIYAAFAIFVPIYFTVALVGYWSWGNSVSGFLLSMSTHPRWLVTAASLMAVVQLLVGEQVFEYVLYEPMELWVLRRFPNAPWLYREAVSVQSASPVVRVPSHLTMFLTRIAYIALVTAVAATFPFFNDIMGLIGAAGYTPLCFLFPVLMHLAANGKKMPRWEYWVNALLGILFSGAGLLAGIGAVRSLVVAIMNHQFYS